MYQASATILASQPNTGLKSFNVALVSAPTIDVSAYKAAATSEPVLKAALGDAGAGQVSPAAIEALRKKLSITAQQSRSSSLIDVQVKSSSPHRAAQLANAVAQALLAWDKDRASSHLQTVVSTLKGQIKSLDAEIVAEKAHPTQTGSDLNGLQQLKAQQSLELNAAQALQSSVVGNLEIVSPAQSPDSPISPRPKLAAVIAAVLAFMASYLLVFLRSALDSRYHSVEGLAEDLGLSVLGEFPRLGSGARFLPRERVNFLRTNLSFASAAVHPKVFLVTSCESGDGKTTVASNVAAAYARNDYRTLLVDADLRKPDLSHMFGVQPEGASDLAHLLKDPSCDPVTLPVEVDGYTFSLLPTNTEANEATESLSHGFRSVLDRLRDFDVIILDSAPILPVADSLVIAPHSSGVVLAASLKTTDRNRIRNTLGLLQRLGVKVFGLAVTHVADQRGHRGSSSYGYGYGYGYGEPKTGTKPPSPRRSSPARRPRLTWEGGTRPERGLLTFVLARSRIRPTALSFN